MATTYLMAVSVFSSIDYAEGCRLGEELVRKAISLDGGDADARGRLAIVLFQRGDLEGSILEADCALEINANCTDALGARAGALIFSGRHEEGRKLLEQFLSASLRDPMRPVRMTQFAASLYLDKDYEGAERITRQVIRQYPGSMAAHRWLAASLGQLGRDAEAQETLRAFLGMSPYSIKQLTNRAPFFSIEAYQHMLEGLCRAGWRG
jgi:tetratricopeptide (TPR) repeat protein